MTIISRLSEKRKHYTEKRSLGNAQQVGYKAVSRIGNTTPFISCVYAFRKKHNDTFLSYEDKYY